MTDAIEDLFKTEEGNVNYLEQLVGEGKKFASVEDLAKGKAESDRFINTLQAELAETRAEVQKRLGIEEFLTKMNSKQDTSNTQDKALTGQPGTPSQLPDIETIVRTTLEKAEAERRAKANREAVVNTLKSVYGNEAAQKLREAANAFGMKDIDLVEVGVRSPEAFKAMLGLNTNTPGVANVPTSTVRAPVGGSGDRDSLYYDNLRKTDPKRYFSQEVQAQRHRDALKLGERFFK